MKTLLFSSFRKFSISGPRSCTKAPFRIHGLMSHISSGSSSLKIFWSSSSKDKESYRAFLCSLSLSVDRLVDGEDTSCLSDRGAFLAFSSSRTSCFSASFISSEISDFAVSTSSPSSIIVSSSISHSNLIQFSRSSANKSGLEFICSDIIGFNAFEFSSKTKARTSSDEAILCTKHTYTL